MSKSKTTEVASKQRNAFYKHWHDQYRRNKKYSEWDQEKKFKALKRKMKKYDKDNA